MSGACACCHDELVVGHSAAVVQRHLLFGRIDADHFASEPQLNGLVLVPLRAPQRQFLVGQLAGQILL
jgi:hypothetical protein